MPLKKLSLYSTATGCDDKALLMLRKLPSRVPSETAGVAPIDGLTVVATRGRSETSRMSKMRIVKGVLILFGVVLAIAAFYPFRTTVAPLWRVRFVDDAKSPLRNATVKEVWKHYSLESQSHEQDLSTDNEGYVTF